MTLRENERLAVVETQITALEKTLAGMDGRLTGMDGTLTELRDRMLAEKAADAAQARLTKRILAVVSALAVGISGVVSVLVNVLHP